MKYWEYLGLQNNLQWEQRNSKTDGKMQVIYEMHTEFLESQKWRMKIWSKEFLKFNSYSIQIFGLIRKVFPFHYIYICLIFLLDIFQTPSVCAHHLLKVLATPAPNILSFQPPTDSVTHKHRLSPAKSPSSQLHVTMGGHGRMGGCFYEVWDLTITIHQV